MNRIKKHNRSTTAEDKAGIRSALCGVMKKVMADVERTKHLRQRAQKREGAHHRAATRQGQEERRSTAPGVIVHGGTGKGRVGDATRAAMGSATKPRKPDSRGTRACRFWRTGIHGKDGGDCKDGNACPHKHDVAMARAYSTKHLALHQQQQAAASTSKGKKRSPTSRTPAAKRTKHSVGRHRGTVRRWDERGFGFVSYDGAEDDIFVHVKDVEDQQALRVRDDVEFNIVPDHKFKKGGKTGIRASSVKRT